MGCKCSSRDIDFSIAVSKEELIELLLLQSDYLKKEIEEIREGKCKELSNSCSKINFLAIMHNESLDFLSKIRKLNISPNDEKFNKLTSLMNDYYSCTRSLNNVEHTKIQFNLDNIIKSFEK